MLTWAHICDLIYAILGTLIVAGIWVHSDSLPAFHIGVLMVLAYFAGSVKYRPH